MYRYLTLSYYHLIEYCKCRNRLIKVLRESCRARNLAAPYKADIHSMLQKYYPLKFVAHFGTFRCYK